jgi:hypothetical protein
MVEREGRQTLGRRRSKIARRSHSDRVEIGRFARASFEQQIVNPETLSLGAAPRRDPFTADAILELRLALDH